MQMRHQTRLGGDGQHQVFIHLDTVNRTDPQAWQIRHQFQDAHDQIAQFGHHRLIRAPAGEVYAGQHHFVEAFVHQSFDLIDHHTGRHRAGIAATVRNDAEGTPVVAAVLHLHIGARAGAKAVDQMTSGFGDRHDVVDLHFFGLTNEISGHALPGGRVHFFGVADDFVDLAHGGESLRLDLCGAACDNNLRVRVVAAQAADFLAAFAHGFCGHRAGVHDHGVLKTGGLRHVFHRL
mmetsp:Transcript_5413/g.8584  ORF Transcript_5413/g.8584 Transcript_5413/m.8584 type:complete len:235 (+) Transcript_5413:1798-2502(+)